MIHALYGELKRDHDEEPDPCRNPHCEDGQVDSGAMTPWGQWITVDCQECEGTGWDIPVKDENDDKRID